MNFDPSWTIEQASEAQTAAEKAGEAGPTTPLFRWAASKRLEFEAKRFNGGDKMALLAAIRICANHDLPLPPWTSSAYIAAYDRVLNCRAKSWDSVFGKPYPAGVHLAARRKRREKSFAVYNEVKRILASAPDTPIDEHLFERVGKPLGLGKTLAGEFYYAVEKQMKHAFRKNQKTSGKIHKPSFTSLLRAHSDSSGSHRNS